MSFKLPTSRQEQDELLEDITYYLESAETVERLEELRDDVLALKTENLGRLADIDAQLHGKKHNKEWKERAAFARQACGHLDQRFADFLGAIRSQTKALRKRSLEEETTDVTPAIAARHVADWVLSLKEVGLQIPESIETKCVLLYNMESD